MFVKSYTRICRTLLLVNKQHCFCTSFFLQIVFNVKRKKEIQMYYLTKLWLISFFLLTKLNYFHNFSVLLRMKKQNTESAKQFLNRVGENPTLLEHLKATQ